MTSLNRSLTTLLGMGVLAAAVTSVEAHQPYRNDTRTYRGYESGRVTMGERKKLAKHRQRVSRVRERAFRDGRVTRKEAKKIDKAQDKLARQSRRAVDDDAWRGYRGDRDDRRDSWRRHRRDRDRWQNTGYGRRDDRWGRDDRRDWWSRDRWRNTHYDRRDKRRGYGHPWWRGWYGSRGDNDDKYGRHGGRRDRD